MMIPDEHFFEHPILNPRYLSKNYPDFFEFLQRKYPDIQSISEKVYWWKYGLVENPICPSCGKMLKFYGFSKGYAKYCSSKCSNSNPSKKDKTIQTCLERYGVENPKQSKDVHNKSIQTCLERYGVENPFANKSIKEKIATTNITKYGVRYTGQSRDVKNKIKHTFIEKYGVESPLQLPKTSINRQESRKRRLLDKYREFVDVKQNTYVVTCPHKKCNKCVEKFYEVDTTIFFDRRRDKTEPCTRLLPQRNKYDRSGLEVEITELLDEYNINYIKNDRTILKPKEIDIFLPDYNVGLECNGVYTHCSLRKSYEYHTNKTEKCNELGIKLYHIWEDWIKNKPEIVKSLLLSKLGIYKNRIYARKCEVREISYQQSKPFLDANHIQGSSKSSIKLGLYHRGELVSVMTFGNKFMGSGDNKIMEGEVELKRFCSKMGVQVIGGASKLLKYFIGKYNPNKIVSFSSNDISEGNLYKKLGFQTNNRNNQSYWWIKNGTLERFHRSNFTKRDIVKLGWKDSVDDSWTEEEVMYEHGYFKIVDSGQIKWILDIKNPEL